MHLLRNMKELGREIRWRVNHLSMDEEAFFKVKKDYKDELNRIESETTLRERLLKII